MWQSLDKGTALRKISRRRPR